MNVRSMSAAVAFAASLAATAATASAEPRIYELTYATDTIDVYRVEAQRAVLEHRFAVARPKEAGALGLAVDPQGNAYTSISSQTGKPCAQCFEEFRPDGTLVARVDAPTLPGAPGAPQLSDLSLDKTGTVYVSDYGQQAVYSFAPSSNGFVGPTVIETGQGAGSLMVSPSGNYVFVGGGCGFAEVKQFVRGTNGYQAGPCFRIGGIGLYGAAADDAGTLFTTLDPTFAAMALTDAKGHSAAIDTPKPHGADTSAALSRDGLMVFIADARDRIVYVYAKPAGGWFAGNPKLIATIPGFGQLLAIAVSL